MGVNNFGFPRQAIPDSEKTQEWCEDNLKAIIKYMKEKGRLKEMEEGSCGYGKDGKVGDEPAGPHLITKADLKEEIKNIIRRRK